MANYNFVLGKSESLPIIAKGGQEPVVFVLGLETVNEEVRHPDFDAIHAWSHRLLSKVFSFLTFFDYVLRVCHKHQE